MDAAVGLVQAYLRINGYLTVTEYPVVVRARAGSRTLTDVDVLAVRFPAAGRWVPEDGRDAETLPADPELGQADDHLEMIIGEVKEGKARLNPAASSLTVVETIIRRFGCCSRDPAATARAVLESGQADTLVGAGMPCRIRRVVFGGRAGEPEGRYHLIPLEHVARFLTGHLDRYRDVFLKTQIKDEALDLLAVLLKVGLLLEAGRNE